MNSVRLSVAVNALANYPEFNQKNIEYTDGILDAVARSNFPLAAQCLKELTVSHGFYENEYRVEIEFCKIIAVELKKLGVNHYHQEMAKLIDFIMDGEYFNLNTAVLTPAISYDRKQVHDDGKMNAAIEFYAERDKGSDVVVVEVLKKIQQLNHTMQNYLARS